MALSKAFARAKQALYLPDAYHRISMFAVLLPGSQERRAGADPVQWTVDVYTTGDAAADLEALRFDQRHMPDNSVKEYVEGTADGWPGVIQRIREEGPGPVLYELTKRSALYQDAVDV